MTGPPAPRIPVSTYRLQFNKEFGFVHARKIIPYLHELGLTDIYASPYLRAKEGSLHGYDIVDHNTINPEVGTEEEYNGMLEELARHGMGQVLDIVPNHMCIDSRDNVWWMDVLENGPSSVYSEFFDIDWKPVKRELENKVLLPILGDQYGKALENAELNLSFEEGAFYISYYENRFPVRPGSGISLLEHGLGELNGKLPPDSPHHIELLSIITALRNLPPYTQTDPEKIAERHREKEVIKKRLRNLYRESSPIRDFVDENVRTFNGVKGEPQSFDLLDGLLREQAYRLSHWRVAADEINYRRFFDINNLASIRTYSPAVFMETHGLVLKLVREGKVTGLRVDHPDGLYDPSGYLYRLQENCCAQVLQRRGEAGEYPVSSEYCAGLLKSGHKPFYIVGEKILIKGETMPEEWPIFSTTGYVFLNSVNGIFVDTGNGKAFEKIYEKFTGAKFNFQDVVYERKKLVMQVALSSEISTLGHYLNRISEKDRHTRDFTLNSLSNALAEVIAFFPVYRTYINSYPVADRDRQYINAAVSKAKRKNPAVSGSIFDFIRDVLLLKFPESFEDNEKRQWLDFTMRFQQITGPVMAKGVEDTSFYVYNRLVSLNEVGGLPERFGTPLETFHGQNIERRKSWPHALIATSTHDTKRGEDVRTRIDVLSEMPEEWRKRLANWNRLNNKKKAAIEGRLVPDKNEEYFIYQTLIGAWQDGPDEVFRARIKEYMLKALREAKVNTSWISPDTAYENAVSGFVERLMDDVRFLGDFRPFAETVSYYGMYYSLSQALLKITSPGVPDFYQGTELWDFSLVDPDNRRPVDFGLRTAMLEGLKKLESEIGLSGISGKLMAGPKDGRIKLYLMWKALNFRRMNRELFEEGEYIPLEAIGAGAESICAFARRTEARTAITAVPRLLVRRTPAEKPPLGQATWDDTTLLIPFAKEGERYGNIYTGEVVTAGIRGDAASISAFELFSGFPVALLDRIY